MANILQDILAHKRLEIQQGQQTHSLDAMKALAQKQSGSRDFIAAMKYRIAQGQAAIIAEIKKASPSKGIICVDFDPEAIARAYQQGQASCLSVLTDHQFFQGSAQYLQQAKAACELPVLRKDFIIDAWQIYESKAMGADAILLIAAALTQDQLFKLEKIALDLGLAVLVEVHNAQELNKALPLSTPLLGINNRNLNTFQVDLQTSVDLLPAIEAYCHKHQVQKIVVSESGIYDLKDVELLRHQGINAFLVGESLMKSDNMIHQLSQWVLSKRVYA